MYVYIIKYISLNSNKCRISIILIFKTIKYTHTHTHTHYIQIYKYTNMMSINRLRTMPNGQ